LRHPRREQRARRQAGEGRMPGQHLVRSDAERVDIGAMIHVRICGRLLGGHIEWRAERRPGTRERTVLLLRSRPTRRTDRLRDAEVGNCGSAGREKNVVGLDVAMHDAALVCVRERARDVLEDRDRFAHRHRALCREARPEGLSFDIRHDEERQTGRLARAQYADDVRVLQPC
jgi:hypothetical protein